MPPRNSKPRNVRRRSVRPQIVGPRKPDANKNSQRSSELLRNSERYMSSARPRPVSPRSAPPPINAQLRNSNSARPNRNTRQLPHLQHGKRKSHRASPQIRVRRTDSRFFPRQTSLDRAFIPPRKTGTPLRSAWKKTSPGSSIPRHRNRLRRLNHKSHSHKPRRPPSIRLRRLNHKPIITPMCAHRLESRQSARSKRPENSRQFCKRLRAKACGHPFPVPTLKTRKRQMRSRKRSRPPAPPFRFVPPPGERARRQQPKRPQQPNPPQQANSPQQPKGPWTPQTPQRLEIISLPRYPHAAPNRAAFPV